MSTLTPIIDLIPLGLKTKSVDDRCGGQEKETATIELFSPTG